MDSYLGIDLGTTGIKAVIIDCDMNVHASASVQSPMIANGKMREFDVDIFCETVFDLINLVVKNYSGPKTEIRALSTSSASGNTVFLNKDNVPMQNAISWTDRRIEGESELYLPNFNTAEVYSMTGWPFIDMFPLAHIAWLKKEKPHVFDQVATFCMSTEYLLYKMCGKWGIDSSCATTFYLLNQQRNEYCEQYLSYFNILPEMLPPILPSKTVLGTILPEICMKTGLSENTKIVLGSFDHLSCARGMGVLSGSDLLISCGTSWAGLYVSPSRELAIEAGMLVNPYLDNSEKWACIFAMTQYGEHINARISEYIDNSENKYDIFNTMAMDGMRSNIEIYCDIADAKSYCAKWYNLSKEMIAYSIMYSACVEVANRIKDMERFGFKVNRIYMSGGPSSSAIWPQILSNCLEREVYCLHRLYCGAVGAAIMASIGDGRFANEHDYFVNKQNMYTIYLPERRIKYVRCQ